MTPQHILHQARLWLGIERNSTSLAEKLISALGAFISILAILASAGMLAAQGLISSNDSPLIVASMGASAVLLFAVPHGALSQPWQVIGGQLLSAAVGVSCALLVSDTMLAAALAVGLAVAVMYLLRCIHPPGGATALTAVIGSEQIHALSYQYLLFPVLMNVVVILLVAVLFNLLFSWRRYPAHLGNRLRTLQHPALLDQPVQLSTEDFAAAIQETDSFVDITQEGLTQLLELAKQHALRNIQHPEQIIAGRFYSNGKIGQLWSIRQVIDDNGKAGNNRDMIIYKVLAGYGDYETGICLREDFRQWASYEVVSEQGRWIKRHARDKSPVTRG